MGNEEGMPNIMLVVETLETLFILRPTHYARLLQADSHLHKWTKPEARK
jgi:hypothetical protein